MLLVLATALTAVLVVCPLLLFERSVVGSVLAVALSMTFGFRLALFVGVAAYSQRPCCCPRGAPPGRPSEIN